MIYGQRLRSMSTKKRSTDYARAQLCKLVRQRDRTCRAAELVPHVRCVRKLDVHEIIPRSIWRLGFLEPTNCILVCRAHHEWIDDNPSEAARAGLHGYSWQRP